VNLPERPAPLKRQLSAQDCLLPLGRGSVLVLHNPRGRGSAGELRTQPTSTPRAHVHVVLHAHEAYGSIAQCDRRRDCQCGQADHWYARVSGEYLMASIRSYLDQKKREDGWEQRTMALVVCTWIPRGAEEKTALEITSASSESRKALTHIRNGVD
jgi:hypothetical protein